MSILNEEQIKYGFDYYRKDAPHSKSLVEVREYNGENTLTINCTQLGDSFTPQYKTQKEKKRVLQEWCDFYRAIQRHLRSCRLEQEYRRNYLMPFAHSKTLESYI